MLSRQRRQVGNDQKSEYLIVDLDQTLINTDIFVESFVRYLSQNPFRIFVFFRHLISGRSNAKALLARNVTIDPSRLPYNEALLAYIREEFHSSGRRIYLATATHKVFAEQIAAYLGIFHGVIATTDRMNRKGKKKLAEIRAVVGNKTWTYAGDSAADMPIWRCADMAILVDAPRRSEKELSDLGKIEINFRREGSMPSAFVRAIRPHQWAKNALIFVPLLTSHSYQAIDSVILSVLAFLSFCLCASGVYLLNDLVDIESDRKHASKSNRPIASGELPVAAALSGAILLPLAAFIIGWSTISFLFFVTVFAYLMANLAYSLFIKRIRTADVLTLAILYTVRIIAGAVAISVVLSSWLLAFSIFLFVSLAYLKRYIEVASVGSNDGALAGRGYSYADCETMFVLGASNATASILVLALFINSDDVRVQYQSPEILWLLCLIMLYWTNRIWVKARTGGIDDDPIAFAVRDKISLVLGLSCVLVVALARYLSIAPGA